MHYVNAARKFLVIAGFWWFGYKAVQAFDYWLETDRAFKGAQVQLAAAGKGNI
jgi:hypothetical protein